MAKDMLDAIYNAEEDCRQREANARAESACLLYTSPSPRDS